MFSFLLQLPQFGDVHLLRNLTIQAVKGQAQLFIVFPSGGFMIFNL